MRETFPKKKAGDPLSARLANKWSDAAKRVSQMYPFSGSLDPQLIRLGVLRVLSVKADQPKCEYGMVLRWKHRTNISTKCMIGF